MFKVRTEASIIWEISYTGLERCFLLMFNLAIAIFCIISQSVHDRHHRSLWRYFDVIWCQLMLKLRQRNLLSRSSLFINSLSSRKTKRWCRRRFLLLTVPYLIIQFTCGVTVDIGTWRVKYNIKIPGLLELLRMSHRAFWKKDTGKSGIFFYLIFFNQLKGIPP